MPRAPHAGNKRALTVASSANRELTAALAAFNQADYSTCRTLLDVAVTTSPRAAVVESELLAARLARIEGDVDAWKAAAERAAAGATSEAQRLTALALIGLAERAAGRNKDADRLLTSIAAAAGSTLTTGSPYPGYLCAFDAWQLRDYDRAERLAKENVRLYPGDVDSMSLLGWIDVKRERFAAAGAAFSRALARGREQNFDLRARARLIHAIALVASDLADAALARKARREYDAMPWPSTLAVERFNTLSCLRLSALVAGDIETSWFYAREAVVVAPADAYRALGETNGSVATALLGDRVTAALQMTRAWEVIRTVRWSDADAEQRVALIHFACEAAQSMPNEARQALMLYISLRGKRNPANSLTEDRRVTAYEAWAAGRVAEAIGASSEAEAHYRQSLAIWQQLHFIVRAAAVARDLRRIVSDTGAAKVIDELRAIAPKAWLLRSTDDAGRPSRPAGRRRSRTP